VVRVGLCEDDPAIRRVVVESLRLSGHETVTAHDGGEAVRLFAGDHDLDVLLIDIGLPDSDGRDVCQALRSAGQHAPVLFLTALASVEDRVSGFGAGGDDYLPKPFAVAELIVRVEALARRGRPAPAAAGEPGVLLDPARHSVRYGDAEVGLTPTEYRLLAAITSRPGEVVRRRAVVAATWPDGSQVSENTLDSTVRRVRGKLDQLGSPMTLHTVRGVGFVLR
jgi:two-component system, OmpR family, response regulator